MESIPEFFKTLCAKKQINNPLPTELLTLLPPTSDGSLAIPLHRYTCLCVGYVNGEKKISSFSLTKCEDKPLLGRHEIWMDGNLKIIDSLSYLKKEILKHEDHISFDRCTFLLLPEIQKVIRLNLLRDRLTLPRIDGESPESLLPLSVPIEKTNQENKPVLYEEIMTSLNQTLFQAYQTTPHEVFIEIVQQTLDYAFDLLEHNLSTPLSTAPPEEKWMEPPVIPQTISLEMWGAATTSSPTPLSPTPPLLEPLQGLMPEWWDWIQQQHQLSPP